MNFKNNKISICQVRYESCIEPFRDHGEQAVITAVLDIDAQCECCFAASLKVDGHELLPTARIDVKRGSNSIELKPVMIINPRRAGQKTDGIYKMLLTLADGSGETLDILTDFSIS